MSALATSLDHCTGGSSQSNKARQRYKRYQIGKERIKLSPCADNVISYVGNPKKYTQAHTLHALKTIKKKKKSSTRSYGARSVDKYRWCFSPLTI